MSQAEEHSAERMATIAAAPPTRVAPDDSRIIRALQEYQAALRAGHKPSRSEFQARYPEIAEAMAECLDGLDFVRVVAPHLSDPGLALSCSPEMQPEAPLGDFRIVREIGRGGMGVVYEAVQISLGRRVALKVLPFASALDPKQLQRFKNEAQAAAQLHHTNIVPVYGVGCERGVHFYAMQYIEGQTLAHVIADLRLQNADLPRRTDRPDEPPSQPATLDYRPALVDPQSAICNLQSAISPTPAVACGSTERSVKSAAYFRTVARLGVQAAEGLEHAHELGVVHRDIKPANLMVDVRGNLWITDFGVAHCQSQAGLTLSGDLVGTLRYMSPEQALGKRSLVDHRTDVYSLGVTLYELLTLQPAFTGQDREVLLRQIALEEPPRPRRLNPAISADLETIVLKAAAKELDSRYATAREMADDLQRFLEERPIRARRPTLAQRAAKWCRRHQGVAVTASVATVILVLAVMAVLAVGLFWVKQEQKHTEAAQKRAEESYRLARQSLEECVKKVMGDPRLQSGPLEDLRRKVLEAESLFYSKFIELRGNEPDFRFERGQALLSLAYTVQELGSMEQAIPVFQQAVSLFGDLVRDYPTKPEYLCELGRSYNNLGITCLNLHRNPEAEQALQQAFALRQRLARDHPDVEDYQADLATAHHNLGLVYHNNKARPKEAEQAFLEAVAIRKKLVHDHPSTTDYRARLADTYGRLAGIYEATDRLERAVQTCVEALPDARALARDHPTVRQCQESLAKLCFQLSNLYEKMGRRNDAEQAYLDGLQSQKALARDHPNNPELQDRLAGSFNNLAVLYGKSRRYQAAEQADKEALKIRQALVRDYPDNLDNAFRLGTTQNNLGEWNRKRGQFQTALTWFDQAIATLENVLAKDPKRFLVAKKGLANAHWGKAAFLADSRKPALAVKEYREGIRLNPDRAKTYLSLGALLCDKTKDYDGAVAAFREFLRRQPTDPLGHYCLGNAFLGKGAVDEAIASYQEAIRLKPAYAAAVNNLGTALQMKGELEEAIAAFKEAIRLDPNHVPAHVNLGSAFKEKGALDEAIASYKDAIRLKPDYALAYNNLGLALQAAGALDDAITAWKEAVRLKPDCAEAHNNLGAVLARKEVLDEAIPAFTKAFCIQPDDPKFFSNLTNALVKKGAFDEAIAVCKQAICLRPDFADAYWHLAFLRLKKKRDYDGAIAAFRGFLGLRKTDAPALYNLGKALYLKGALDEAIAAYKEAIRLKPDYAEAFCNLGHALQGKGQFREALAAFRRGHELGSAKPGWRYPSARWLQECERLVDKAEKTATPEKHAQSKP